MQHFLPDGTRQRSARCIVCYLFNIKPISLSFDQTSEHPSEADDLCALHRARMTEGYCVRCARRTPWAIIWKGGITGVCRTCFTQKYGKKFTRHLERGRKGWPEGLWYVKEAA